MQIRNPLRHESQQSTCCNKHTTNLCVNEINENPCFKKTDKESTSVTKTRKHPRQRMKQKKAPAATDQQKPMRPLWTHFLKFLMTEVIFFFELAQDLLKVIQTATLGLRDNITHHPGLATRSSLQRLPTPNAPPRMVPPPPDAPPPRLPLPIGEKAGTATCSGSGPS